jgi:cytochrome c oxidase assembly protein subunit 15
LFLYPWQTWIFGPWKLLIEHGHRLLGATVGLLTILFVVAVWLCDRRGWVRGLSLLALAAVIIQGVLGGQRVILDDVQLARIHGCFGPAFFALTVALATITSRLWLSDESPRKHAGAGRLQRLALLTTLFAYVQLVLGSQLRHLPLGTEPSQFRAMLLLHLAMTAVVVIHVVLLTLRVLRSHRDEPPLVWPAVGLAGLTLAQLALGVGTWVGKYGWPAWLGQFAWAAGYTVEAQSRGQSLTTTAHVAAGSLILVTSLMLALRALRLTSGMSRPRAAGRMPVEVAA